MLGGYPRKAGEERKDVMAKNVMLMMMMPGAAAGDDVDDDDAWCWRWR
jgi:hypothetical protein